ncbi:hypothetical protein KJN74_05270 [Candidatus Bathyarchaeota archaeon]|nr:hypothetical protein [Candidatus Bathyarchaeota archaeon]
MGNCSFCENNELASNPLSCKVCGKEGCKDCMTYLFSFFQYGIEPQFHENWYCHNSDCYEIFVKKMEDSITVDILDREKFGVGLLQGVFHNAIKNFGNQLWLKNNVSNSLSRDDFLFTNGNLELVSRVEEFGNKGLNKPNNEMI